MKAPTATRAGLGNTARGSRIGLAAAVLACLGGCVQVAAPERPIEINLNINIRQEVVVRLTEDVQRLREREPGVF